MSGASAAQLEVMEKVPADLWNRIRELKGEYAIFPDGVGSAVATAEEALKVLEGDLYKAVVGDGGVHGSPEAAWAAWQDLAISTGDNLAAAAGYANGYTLTGYIKKAAQVVADTGKTIGAGAGSLMTTLTFIIGAFVVIEILRTARSVRG